MGHFKRRKKKNKIDNKTSVPFDIEQQDFYRQKAGTL
jgi:hypothetical protein